MKKYLTPFEMGVMIGILDAARHHINFRADRRAERSLLRKGAITLRDEYWACPTEKGLDLYAQGLCELLPPSKHLLVRVLKQGGFLTSDRCLLSAWSKGSSQTAEVFGLVRRKRVQQGALFEITREGRKLLNAWDSGLGNWFPGKEREKSPVQRDRRLLAAFEK